MIRSKIIYLIILTGMILFYILFVDSMSLMILVITLLFPFLQLFILMRISRSITAVLSTESASVQKSTPSKIIVKIRNSSLLPVSCAVVDLSIMNTLTGEVQPLTTMLPVSSDNDQSVKFSVSYAHLGKVQIVLKSIKIFDYVKLFSKTIKCSISQDITVVPTYTPVSPDVRTKQINMNENDEFSKIKPGDDCSEIFNIREYAYGDKLNRIHWNLTTKLDELMVKEYSLPVSSQIIIVFEFCSDRESKNMFYKNDAAIETAMALSYYMTRNSISHKIAWYDPRTKLFHTESITSENDFSDFLSAVFSSGTYTDTCSAFLHCRAESRDVHYSHEIYISPVISDELFHNFSVLTNASHKTFLYINDSAIIPGYFTDSETTRAIAVDFDNIEEGLNQVIV